MVYSGQNQPITDPKQALFTSRLIWFAMIMGQLVFMLVVVLAVWPGGSYEGSEITMLMTYVNIAMLLTTVPVVFFVRNQIYKKNWQENRVTPQGYVTGNIVLFAGCEGVALFGIVVTMLHGSFGLPIVPAVIALGVLAFNFPNGRPMEGQDPAFVSRNDEQV